MLPVLHFLRIVVPIPTYFILAGDNAAELVDDNTNGVRLCQNLTFLGALPFLCVRVREAPSVKPLKKHVLYSRFETSYHLQQKTALITCKLAGVPELQREFPNCNATP